MSTLGFVESLLDDSNQFYRVALEQFEWYKKIQGTKVLVTRIKENTSYRNVFGAIANSTLPGDDDVESFNYVVLISLNDMKRLYLKSTDPIQFYDNKNELKLGDILTFARGSQVYKWKITEVQTFSETEDLLQMYTIVGLMETNSLV